MTAQDDDPWVAVSVLGEHMFCPRAGVLQYIAEVEEDMPFSRQPVGIRKGLLHTIASLKREMKFAGRSMAIFLGGALLLVIIGLATTGRNGPELIQLGCYLAALPLAIYGLMCGRRFLQVSYHYMTAVIAASVEPDPDSTEVQSVRWWRLLQNGWQVTYTDEMLRDTKWRIQGRPWRVLQKGGMRVPVSKKKGKHEIHKSHFARLAAYCHLLERAEPGSRSPYGVVLFMPGYSGKTIPHHRGSRVQFHRGLVEARRSIKKYLASGRVAGPRNTGLCRGCTHGRPTSEDWGETFTSTCGSTFHWTPPHDRAYQKDLL